MKFSLLRTIVRALFAVSISFLFAGTSDGASVGSPRGSSPESFLEHGMPLAARSEFLKNPPASRARSPLLPILVRRLAEAGYPGLALSLFDEVRPLLAEPVRSEAFLEAGKIHYGRKEFGKATEAFRQVSPKSDAAFQAAYYRSRLLAAAGDVAGAMDALSAAPIGGKRSLLAGEIEMARQKPAAALSAWAGAPYGTDAGFSARLYSMSRSDRGEGLRELKSIADNAAAGIFPKQAAARKALAFSLLARKDYEGALSAARQALDNAARWKAAAEKTRDWDGTREGALRSWTSLASLFPYDEDASNFLSAGRRFLAAASLNETVRAAQEENRGISRRVSAAMKEISSMGKVLAGKRSRAEEIRKGMLERKRKAAEVRNRIREVADSLPLPAWGAMNDPKNAARIEETGKKLQVLRERIARVRSSAAEKARRESLPPEDRRMLFHAQQQAERIEDRLSAIEGETAFLRMKTWNRWKSEYVARLAGTLAKAEAAAKAAGELADRSARTIQPIWVEQNGISSWMRSFEWFRKRLASADATLEDGKAAVKAFAQRCLAESGMELRSAILRDERGVRYLAARASTEWQIEDLARPPDGKTLEPARLADLRTEAIGHWKAVLPPGGGRDGLTDEALYALAELRFLEEASAFYRREAASGNPGDGKDRGAFPDHSESQALFRRVIDGFPASPYSEQAHYGLALSLQEGGATDNAASAMKALLARFPASRYADEINLRLGESAFDEDDFREAEEAYRKVSVSAPPEIRVTAYFKLGWSLFLQGRPGEAADPFLSALLLSPAAGKTGGVGREALTMSARTLIEAGKEKETETLLERRGAAGKGPALLLEIQRALDGQNRYVEAAAVADRIGRAYPAAAELLDAEVAAAEALRKAGKDEESHARRGRFHLVLGPGSPWRASPSRGAAEAARADAVAEEGLRSAVYYFHARSRKEPPGDRAGILALYDAYLSRFPSSPGAGEIAYQRAWLLFEDGRKKEAKSAFEDVALRRGSLRGEASRYMAVQCAKDISKVSDGASQAEVVRLCGEYERDFPRGERLQSILLDRARAHVNLRQFGEAAKASEGSAALAKEPRLLRAALRISGDSRFEEEKYDAAEKAFRAFLASSPPADEAREAEKWVGFSMFRRAEKMPAEQAGDAAALFARVAMEFPSLEIAPTARFRAGEAYASAGKTPEAIAAFLSLESSAADSSLSLDSTRWLARLYEKTGDPVSAAVRYERLAAVAGSEPAEKIKIFLKAADLFSMGKDEPRARKNLLAAATLPDAPPDIRVQSLYRCGESARMEGNADEADRYYREAIAANGPAPGILPGIAGKALFRRAESRFVRYQALTIGQPLEKTFEAKKASLGECGKLYLEAITVGDAETVSASLHRLGEAFEDFRSAILASPPPKKLSDREREEYVFLLEEKAAPIEEEAVEAYQKNLRQAVAAETWFEWAGKSLQRLKILRPARFGKKGEFAFPVVPVPDFRGMIERSAP